MSDPRSRSKFLSDEVTGYISAHTSVPDAVQADLVEATAKGASGWAGMQIGHDQAVFMEMLARAMGARRALEVGTFTGYSALALARGMGPDGRLVCCDVSEEWTAIARTHWEAAGVADRIDLRIGPALDTIAALSPGDRFDLVFVDADKERYPQYYEAIVPRLRDGGLLLADNTLWGGRVLDPEARDAETAGIRSFNDRAASDLRVRLVLLPLGDGVTVVQRLEA